MAKKDDDGAGKASTYSIPDPADGVKMETVIS